MTNQQKLDKEVEIRLNLIASANKESSQIQIWVEHGEVIKTNVVLGELLSYAERKKSKKMIEGVRFLKHRLRRQEKLVRDLKYYEGLAYYFKGSAEMVTILRKENQILVDRFINK